MIPFDWAFAWSILPELLAGTVVALEATVVAALVAIGFGLVLALLRRSRLRIVALAAAGFIEFIRATPLLVQLYFLFFVLPVWGITLSPFATGVIGLGLHYACYMAEVYRAGIESVPRGQWEAGKALNFSRAELYRYIVLPQAIPPMIPAMGNYLVSMLKDTPILAAITVVEATQVAREISSNTFLFIEPMTLVGIIMLVLSLLGAWVVRRLDRRLGALRARA